MMDVTDVFEGTEGWAVVSDDAPVYRPRRGRGGPVRGWLVAIHDMPLTAEGRAWRTAEIELTARCDYDDGLTLDAGRRVKVPLNAALETSLAPLVRSERREYQVVIAPESLVPTSHGEMIRYRVLVSPTPRDRVDVLRLASEPRVSDVRALSAGDVPF